MSLNVLLLLLLTLATVKAGKYVYVEQNVNWKEAQRICRTNFTDLAPINSEHDNDLIQELNPKVRGYTWIGLIKATNSSSGWMWSGGGEVTSRFWAKGEPNNAKNREDRGFIYRNKYRWNDAPGQNTYDFLCYKVHAIRKKMTWDDALSYCREHHQDLASVASVTEMMLIHKELDKTASASTDDVWIGLRFLDAHWLWMDGQPFGYESWGPFDKPTCPDFTFACGALQVKGPEEDQEVGWNALDCEQELHFLCY